MTQEFQRLGVFGDWDQPYLTMDFRYQAAIVRALGKFVEQGLVYKGKKPVHWCIHCRTALAEAEVEYQDHTSPSIYVEFPLATTSAGELAARVPALAGRDVSVLIWTTTPWTIPSNLAIAFHPEFDYAAYDVDGRAVIVAEALAPARGARRPAGRSASRVARMKGDELERIRFQHPLYARESLGVLGDYVTLEAGHRRGAHGAGPRRRRLQHRRAVRPGHLRAGRARAASSSTPSSCSPAQRVFDANPKVEEALHERGRLWHRDDVRAPYPHCWRCHNPVIFLATSQWFIRMDGEPVVDGKTLREGRRSRRDRPTT